MSTSDLVSVRPAAIRLGLYCAISMVLAGGATPSVVATAGQAPGDHPSPTRDRQPAKTFAPGVRIDWVERTVEVDARVVLRKGSLELIACSPKTREHESIFVVQARPMHIFQAMGLIGLEPGSPMRYDEKIERWHAPKGAPLDLLVRFLQEGKDRIIEVNRLVVGAGKKDAIAPRIDWVFAGSKTLDNGRFGADAEGTVVCVVDFETALIAVGALHSADNESLWLEANTELIPPVGTRCSLLIRAARGDRPDSRPEDFKKPVDRKPAPRGE